jgi:hypothetical protein
MGTLGRLAQGPLEPMANQSAAYGDSEVGVGEHSKGARVGAVGAEPEEAVLAPIGVPPAGTGEHT